MTFPSVLPFDRSTFVERRFTMRADATVGERGLMESRPEIVRRRAGIGFGIFGFDIIPGPHFEISLSMYTLAACTQENKMKASNITNIEQKE